MKPVVLGFAFVALFVAAAASAQATPFAVPTCGSETATFSDIRLPQAVLANGRPLAAVPTEDIGTVAKGLAPKPSAFRVDLLKEGEYLRVWMNSGGTHYIVNMPVAR